MSRVLLISANRTVDPYPVYPLGMAVIAASLETAGHTVRQADLAFCAHEGDQAVVREIQAFEPDFIGVSVRNIDTVDSFASQQTWYIESVKTLVATIKNVSTRPVILGGPAFSIMPEQILDYCGADHGIVGEGEALLCGLIRDLENKEKPQRILWPSPVPVNLDRAPLPTYDPALAAYYIDQSGMLNYQTKRGCPHTCNYCSYPVIEGRTIRYQDPEHVVENLIRLQKTCGTDTVFFTDAVFNDGADRYMEIAEWMIRKECRMRWAAYFRPRKMADRDMRLLKQSGLYAIELGSDGAGDTVLEAMGKTFDFDTVASMNQLCIREQVPCAHFFMFGGPGETRETVLEGIENINRLDHCVVFVFSGIRILPDTGIRDIAVRQGVIHKEDSLFKPVYYHSPAIDKDWMNQTLKQAFKRRRDRFFPPEEGNMKMRALKLFGFKGLLWDMAVDAPKARPRARAAGV